MSRLGDLIRTERLRSKMTPKQVARKCGVSESYLLAVEAGTKIIADDKSPPHPENHRLARADRSGLLAG